MIDRSKQGHSSETQRKNEDEIEYLSEEESDKEDKTETRPMIPNSDNQISTHSGQLGYSFNHQTQAEDSPGSSFLYLHQPSFTKNSYSQSPVTMDNQRQSPLLQQSRQLPDSSQSYQNQTHGMYWEHSSSMISDGPISSNCSVLRPPSTAGISTVIYQLPYQIHNNTYYHLLP